MTYGRLCVRTREMYMCLHSCPYVRGDMYLCALVPVCVRVSSVVVSVVTLSHTCVSCTSSICMSACVHVRIVSVTGDIGKMLLLLRVYTEPN